MTAPQNPLERVTLRNPIHFLALGFGSGLLHPAPGTWGSLVGVIVGATSPVRGDFVVQP